MLIEIFIIKYLLIFLLLFWIDLIMCIFCNKIFELKFSLLLPSILLFISSIIIILQIIESLCFILIYIKQYLKHNGKKRNFEINFDEIIWSCPVTYIEYNNEENDN